MRRSRVCQYIGPSTGLLHSAPVFQPDYNTTDTTPPRHSLNAVLMLDQRL